MVGPDVNELLSKQQAAISTHAATNGNHYPPTTTRCGDPSCTDHHQRHDDGNATSTTANLETAAGNATLAVGVN